MRLVVISHKVCRRSADSPTGYVTDGGFPLQMHAISDLFSHTKIVVPCDSDGDTGGLSPLAGKNVVVVPLTTPKGEGIRRKVNLVPWLIRNGLTIFREIYRADAVHTPIPGDVGTIGMVLALLLRKRLFVRHCGNWLVQRTPAERLWIWSMEYFAGGRNVMLATGGGAARPSIKNANVKWIFSTSVCHRQIQDGRPRSLPQDGNLRIAIACRQEPRKGTDVVIKSMPLILKAFPKASLDVIGGGSQLSGLKALSKRMGLEEVVRFHGKLRHKEVLLELERANIFCFPTTASEGFPKAVLEAMAAGLPVITTHVSVLPELMRLGGGVLIDKPEPAMLAAAVGDVCSSQLRYGEMSAKAIETVRQYSLEDWQARIAESLRESWGVTSLAEELQPVI